MADSLATRIATGAAAGLAGTIALRGVMAANQKLLPETLPPMQGDPAEFMVQQARSVLPPGQRARIPEGVHDAVEKGLGPAYGMTFGVLYGLLTPRHQRILACGALLGLATWAAGYLGWLPATGLMPPITKQRPEQVAGPIVTHLLFGIGTAALYALLRGRTSARG
jgi:hypothetical protein